MGSWSRLLTFCHGHVGLDVGVAVDVVDAQGLDRSGDQGVRVRIIFPRECVLICFEWVGRNRENRSRLATFQHTEIFSVAEKLVVPQANLKISFPIQIFVFSVTF